MSPCIVYLSGRLSISVCVCPSPSPQDPLQPGEKVILVHSLVEGGAAEEDGRLRIGDKLLSVNNIYVLNHSLDFAVQQLVAVPLGGSVTIGVQHPLPGGPELETELCSPYSMEGDEEVPINTIQVPHIDNVVRNCCFLSILYSKIKHI